MKHSSKKQKPSILLLDFYSEKNRGDAALQVALTKLTQKTFPDTDIHIVSAMGANLSKMLLGHFAWSSKEHVPVVGGIAPTFLGSDGESSNFGHSAIYRKLHALYSLCFTLYVLLVSVLPVKNTYKPFLVPQPYRTTYMLLVKADLIIWRGTNFRLGKSTFQQTHQTYRWLYQVLVCILLRKQVAVVGISIWPVKNRIAKSLFRFVLNRCFFVGSREQLSFRRLQHIIGKESKCLHLVPDLSFYFLNEYILRVSDRATPTSRIVGMTITDRHGSDAAARQKYILTMASLLDKILEDREVNVKIIPQVTAEWEQAGDVLKEILKCTENNSLNRVEVLAGEFSSEELLKEYAHLDYLIATRLHSSIFALSVGVPVFVMRYDTGPQWEILSMLNMQKYVIDYKQVGTVEVLSMFEAFCRDKHILGTEAQQKMISLHQDILDKFGELNSAFHGRNTG